LTSSSSSSAAGSSPTLQGNPSYYSPCTQSTLACKLFSLHSYFTLTHTHKAELCALQSCASYFTISHPLLCACMLHPTHTHTPHTHRGGGGG
jgi:hypothetical protein